MHKTVAILGTLDSKGPEFDYLRRQIESQGAATIVIDAGVFDSAPFRSDISSNEVARAAGASLASLAQCGDRGEAIAAMGRGAASVVMRLFEERKIDGIISMGGGGGTSIAAAALKGLPVGFPKLIVSTLASGDTRSIVDINDILMMPSVVDIAGINRLSSRILSNAAGAIVGMVNISAGVMPDRTKPVVAASMFGVTTPCVARARQELEAAGFEVLVFHAVGTGGRTLEELVRAGYFAGVLDVTTTELADELVGGILSAGPRRLEAAGEVGIPQVVSAGALDVVNFAGPDSVPEKFRSRLLYRHNPLVTLMRTTPEESARLGGLIAAKLNKAKGPTTFIIPSRGLSSIDVQGGPFYDPVADRALFDALRSQLASSVRLVELDTDINDAAFAVEAARLLIASMSNSQ